MIETPTAAAARFSGGADDSNRRAAELASEVANLLSFPKTATRLLELLGDPDSSNKEIGAVLATDPALSVRVLRMANSAYYSPAGRADTVERAIAALGREQLRDLTLGISAVHSFDGIPVHVVSMDEFWSHSIYCGIIAEQLARRLRPSLAGTAFTAGLLHDVGQLVLFTRRPSESLQALGIAAESGEEISMAEAERRVLGCDHAAVGLALARAWRLPESLLDCIAFHHAPASAVSNEELVAVVHVANSLSFLVETEQVGIASAPPMEATALDIVGDVREALAEIAPQARERYAAVYSLLST